MIQITSKDVTADIWALFDITQPTMPRGFNVLDGTMRGHILVDDPAHPTCAVVRETEFGTLYLGGHVDQSLLYVLVDQFRQFGDAGIGCWLDDPLNEMLPPEPDYEGFTYYFPERSRNVELQSLLRQVPAGMRLVRRDARLFASSFDYEATLACFGAVEQVMQHTLAMMILDGDSVVCEASTRAPTHGRIEISVNTAESHHQRGLATMACASLIVECEARGYSTWWNCAKQNVASQNLAKKLGFLHGHEYHYVMWSRQSSKQLLR